MAYTLPSPGYSNPLSGLGGSGGGLLQLILSLVGQAQGGFNEAKQANESRYNDILGLLGDNRKRTMDSLNGFGQSMIDDENRTSKDRRNNLIADLADRGLSGSTKRIAVEN